MQFAMAAESPVAIRSRRAEVCALGNTPCRLLLLPLLSCRNAVVRECTEAELSRVDPNVAIAGAMAVLLSAVPFSWAALSTYLNTAHAKRTGGEPSDVSALEPARSMVEFFLLACWHTTAVALKMVRVCR